MKSYRSNRTTKFGRYAVVALGVVVVGAVAFTQFGTNKAKVLAAATTPAARNDVRRSELKTLSAALVSYVAAKGSLPVTVAKVQTGICTSTGTVCKTAKLVDLSFLGSDGYITGLPSDPVGGRSQYGTGYTIGHDPATGELVLTAPRAEAGAVISQVVK